MKQSILVRQLPPTGSFIVNLMTQDPHSVILIHNQRLVIDVSATGLVTVTVESK